MKAKVIKNVSGRMIHCPWCSKTVAVKNSGYLAPHLTTGGLRCGGGAGFKASQVEFINEANNPNKE